MLPAGCSPYRLVEHRAHHALMGGRIPGSSQRQAERVCDETRQRRAHQLGDRGNLRDRDRRDSRLVETPLKQSDRLLAGRSSGNEEHQVSVVAPEVVRGKGDMPVEDQAAVQHRSQALELVPGGWFVKPDPVKAGPATPPDVVPLNGGEVPVSRHRAGHSPRSEGQS